MKKRDSEFVSGGEDATHWVLLGVGMGDWDSYCHNRIEEIEPGLTGIGTVPGFAIGQRALLVRTPNGNVLWDCISLLDEDTVEAVRALGGISAIAVSHPHTVGSVVEWSHAFDYAPIYWHADNRRWVMRPDRAFEFWEGETHPLLDGITLIRCGGHFEGSTVLHWSRGAEGRGALLTGDTIMVVSDRRYVSFMYSYPNRIPLNRRAVERIVNAVEPYEFIRLCPAARNYFLGRWEAPLPSSPVCNAACLGCISLQPSGCCPSTQERISFVPTPREIESPYPISPRPPGRW